MTFYPFLSGKKPTTQRFLLSTLICLICGRVRLRWQNTTDRYSRSAISAKTSILATFHFVKDRVRVWILGKIVVLID